MLLYVNIYHVFDGDRSSAATLIGVMGLISMIVSILTMPLGGWVSAKFGKRRAVFIMLGLIIVGRASQFWLITPTHPYLQLISMLIYTPGVMLMWALIPSMVADVCDLDELESGRRREASFSAMYQWMWKLGATLAMLLGGILLGLVGATTDSPDAVLSVEVIFRLRLILSGVSSLMAAVALVCVWFYPLTEKQMVIVKEKLKQKKLEIGAKQGVGKEH